MKTLNSLKFLGFTAAVLGTVLVTACQPKTESPSSTSADTAPPALTMAQASTICSTLAVARNTPDFNALALVFDSNVVSKDPFSPTPVTSLEQYKQFTLGLQAAFPDFTVRYDDIAVSGDRIFAQWTASGTQGGTFYTLPPTGKRVTVSGMSVMKVREGKVVEHQNFLDLLTIANQLGAHLATGEGTF